MDYRRFAEGGFSSIGITAALAVLILIGAMIRQSYIEINDQNTKLTFAKPVENTQESSDDLNTESLSAVDAVATDATSTGTGDIVLDQLEQSYIALKESGQYSPQAAKQIGTMIGSMIKTDVTFKPYSERDFLTTHDFSPEASAKYLSNLHDALAPLRKNTTPEFEIFNSYILSKKPIYLQQLKDVANLYSEAAVNVSHVITPIDTVSYSVSIANSLTHFSAVLNALILHADDPAESIAMLSEYNTAEQSVLNSFSALNLFYANKH